MERRKLHQRLRSLGLRLRRHSHSPAQRPDAPGRAPEQHPGLTTALRTPELYLVPRGDRRIVIGATVEDAGYDKHIDPSVIAALHNAAAQLWPPLREARIIDTWAGLRPASADFLPVIGTGLETGMKASESEPSPRSWLALGHFRNGILLAPGTARLLRQMILQEPASIDASAFSGQPLHRFRREIRSQASVFSGSVKRPANPAANATRRMTTPIALRYKQVVSPSWHANASSSPPSRAK